ncbi:MAG: DNA gyrase modulator [Actinomycetota bacterium]|nr:DNA gyrase modulator [Actinomycetota bacterium]
MPENFRDIIRYAADKISKRGVDDFEVYAISSKENQIEVYQQDIESLSFSESSGIGIRIINNSSVGYAYTSFLEKQQILDCIDRAVANAQATNSEEFNSLPQSDDYLYPAKDGEQELSFDDNFLNYTMNDKALAAKKLEYATKARDKRIIGISNSSYQDSEAEVILINSNGFFDSYKKSWCYLYVNAISRAGEDTSTGDYFGCGKHLGEIDIEDIAGNAAQKSVSVLGGKKIKSRKADLLLHPLVGAQFLSLIAGALTAIRYKKEIII